MLRDLVGTFLETLSERDFDAPLLALLANKGYYDIHFVHGGFEFGKDVIAKRRTDSGTEIQYAIQSKAGDITQAGWREVRPQLEEAEYNTRAHPGFSSALPRVAVLLLTGRLKGAAAVDAQEFREAAQKKGLADFEVWDKTDLITWMCQDPTVGLLASPSSGQLSKLIAQVETREISEPIIERYARAWLPGGSVELPRAAIEAAVIVSTLRSTSRLDLAVLATLALYRAASTSDLELGPPIKLAAERAFVGAGRELLVQLESHLEDPREIVWATTDALGLVTYSVAGCRLTEILALLSLQDDDESFVIRARDAVLKFVTVHPGVLRPPSDQFAIGVVPIAIVLSNVSLDAARDYLATVARWLVDSYDSSLSGLGLGSLDEDEVSAIERLLGGPLEVVSLERRQSSYLACLVLDLCLLIGATELYSAVLDNLDAVRVVPSMTAADERTAHWRRGGGTVVPVPRVDYGGPGTEAAHHRWPSPASTREVLLLQAACRSRHYFLAIADALTN